MTVAVLATFVVLLAGFGLFVEVMAFRSVHAAHRPTVVRQATENSPAVELPPAFRPASPREKRLLVIYVLLLTAGFSVGWAVTGRIISGAGTAVGAAAAWGFFGPFVGYLAARRRHKRNNQRGHAASA